MAYLVYLGVQQWRAPVRPLAEVQAGAASIRRRDLVLRGFVINALNPKGTVFLLAVWCRSFLHCRSRWHRSTSSSR